MTYTTFSSGSGIASSPMNNNFLAARKIQEVYTGTGFDSSGTGTGEYEMTAITAANLGSADYLIIKATVYTRGDNDDADGGSAFLTFQTKETGSGYLDSMAEQTVWSNAGAQVGHGTQDLKSTRTVEWVHTLTSGEKTNGVQVKIKGRTSISGTASAELTNVQTFTETSS